MKFTGKENDITNLKPIVSETRFKISIDSKSIDIAQKKADKLEATLKRIKKLNGSLK